VNVNNIVQGMPIVDNTGVKLGTTSRVHPERFFTDPVGGLVVPMSMVDRVEDGVIHLNVDAETLRSTGVNPRRVQA